MAIPHEYMTKVLLNEIFRHRRIAVGIFVLINLAAVSIGLMWPKTFTSWATIYIEEKNIIQPLMQGAAVATDARDRAKMAKEVIFSRNTMYQALEQSGWFANKPDDIQKQKLAEEVKARTSVVTVGPNLIKIEYRDNNPERAFKTAQKFSELFLSDSLGNQTEESQQAFEFIDNQTQEYHAKLTSAEQALKEFNSQYVDARPGTDAEVAARINVLEGTIEKTTLELKEARIKQASIEKQLSGEAEVTISLTREGQYLSRIAELQAQLDTLRLSYHDTYPDIVRIQHQIEDLKEAAANEKGKRETQAKTPKAGDSAMANEDTRVNPLYQQLRRELSETKVSIETLSTRLAETKHTLNGEVERAKKIHAGEADLAELTRDYEVNRDIYHDLLKRRETARVSRNLDRDKQGLTLKIYEPAALPLQPSGLRFEHFAAGGMLLSVLVPPGLLFGLQRVDPRLRVPVLIPDRLKLPVLATIPHLETPAEAQGVARDLAGLTSVFFVTAGFVVTVTLLKALEVI